MLLKCPECSKDVSDTAPACPHCGYIARATATQLSQTPSTQRAATFQFISLGAVVVALFTPRLLVSLPCLAVIAAAVVALVRKEPRWLLSVGCILAAILIMGSGPSSPGSHSSDLANMRIEGWEHTTERNYTYVRGRIKNVGARTVSYYKITAYYRDANGSVLDTDYTISAENLRPGMAKEFEIMHRASPEYKNITIAIEEVITQ